MNILFLNSLGKTKWGGGEKWMISAGKGLMEKDHRVIIACLPGSKIEHHAKENRLEIFHFHIPADIALWKMPLLRSFLKENHIDVLVCCQNKDVRIGARAAKKAGVPAIFARQGIQNLSNRKKYIKPFTQYIDGIITNTKSIKEIYESFGWFPDHFIHVIYNGVEIPDRVDTIDLHEKFNLPPDSKIIISSGRLDYQKGFDVLIKVAVKAKENNFKWQFLIAGKGKLKKELNVMAIDAGVSGMVHFIGFFDRMPALLQASDVFVLPSRYEGMPNALLEAMAVGKASVATRVNGVPELVEDGISGFLAEPENPQQIFEKLYELLTNDDLRKSMEQKARKHVENHFTMEKMAGQLEALFSHQLENPRQNNSHTPVNPG